MKGYRIGRGTLYLGGTFSIHTLREEGDLPVAPGALLASAFLSTPSARRATNDMRAALAAHEISIHALREEGDGRITW